MNQVTRDYSFTNDWFDVVKPVWEDLVPQINPHRILEIGSYEGASTCYLIDKLAAEHPLELHCIDTWEGGAEHPHAVIAMSQVEEKFHANTALAIRNAPESVELVVHKGFSDLCLAQLIAEGQSGKFDFVYVDGSHQAPDVFWTYSWFNGARKTWSLRT